MPPAGDSRTSQLCVQYGHGRQRGGGWRHALLSGSSLCTCLPASTSVAGGRDLLEHRPWAGCSLRCAWCLAQLAGVPLGQNPGSRNVQLKDRRSQVFGLLILPQYSQNVNLPPGTPAFPSHFCSSDYSETEQLLYYIHASTFITSTVGLFHVTVFHTYYILVIFCSFLKKPICQLSWFH